MFQIGFYGIPGGPPGGLTHIVINKRPICGTIFDPKSEFQWCSNGLDYIPECKKCKKILEITPTNVKRPSEMNIIPKRKFKRVLEILKEEDPIPPADLRKLKVSILLRLHKEMGKATK